jgi:general nucleoside transport system permease protein
MSGWFARLRLEKRDEPGTGVLLVVPLVSVLAALLFGAVFLSLIGLAPLAVYREMLRVSYTTGYGVADTLVSATPLILTGLAAAVAFRFKLYNIGGEGQLYVGAIAASGVALAVGDEVAGPVAILLVVLAGALGGAVWIAVPALAKAWLGTSEIITSLLLNYVALFLMQYLIFGARTFWRDPQSATFPQGAPIPADARLPTFGTTRVNVGLLIAVVAAVVLYLLLTRTRTGYRWRVFGDAPAAARYAGIPSRQVIVVVLLLSGALAGLAGATEVAGRAGRLDPTGLALNIGYNGIIVAALARYNPLAVLPVGLLLGGILNAGPALQSLPGARVPVAISTMLTGAILLFALAGELFVRYRVRVRDPAEVQALAGRGSSDVEASRTGTGSEGGA